MPERQLRRTIDDVQGAIGDLIHTYNEPDALRLIRALGPCDVFVAPGLDYRHTPEQEAARRGFHRLCLLLSDSIRRAIGYPGRAEHERQVVFFAAEMGQAVDEVRAAFDWPRAA